MGMIYKLTSNARDYYKGELPGMIHGGMDWRFSLYEKIAIGRVNWRTK